MYILYTTMLINLKKSEDELWEQIWNVRTDIRKAIKNWVEIITNPQDYDINEAYELYLKMMKKKHLPVLRDYKLWNSETRKIIIWKYKWKVISYIQFQLFSKIDLLGKSKICALETIASDDNYKNLSWNTLLYWEWIKFMKSLWFEYLNFNWVSYQYWDSDFNSLAFFKKKWNWIEIQCVSEKSLLWYVYWRWFRKYNFVKRIVYFLLINLFKNKYLKY
jgi:hypothetical protein